MDARCHDCGHPASEHDAEVGCNVQAGTRWRCLCYWSPEMVNAPSFDAAQAMWTIEKQERLAARRAAPREMAGV